MQLGRDDIDRFVGKIAGSRGKRECWRWVGGFDKDGYGVMSVGRRTIRAHRLSWWIAHGYEPPGRVLHGCRHRWCVNPHHLDVGTQKENVEDMRLHGTLATGDRNGSRVHPERLARGSRVASAKLTENEIKRIMKRIVDGESMQSVGASYGVNKSTISRVVNGQAWRHV